MMARPASFPATNRVLNIASLIGTFTAMYFKGKNDRPRPSQLCPALMPPLAVPGHASFPSGHSTQAHLMALCMTDVFGTLPMAGPMNDDLWTLADRIARNREIAGLHYPSDTKAGVDLGTAVHALLQPATQTRYQASVAAAKLEWS